MMKKQTVLIVDDEEKIVKIIADFLSNSGFNTICAYDGDEALDLFNKNQKYINLAIIDIMIPKIDGWRLTEIIRKRSSVPIIMLSARSEDFDMLTGFEAGIDEYVTKPFSPVVLVKRIEALLKRSESNNALRYDNEFVIDEEEYNVYINNQKIDLTLKEFELLLHLYKNSGLVLSRDKLLDAVWGYDYYGDNRTVDSHIARLRGKLGNWGATHLKTVYGMGYKLEF